MRAIVTLVAFVSLGAAGASPALAAGPQILVLPNSVAQGSTANVYGTGFCPSSSGCSPVSIAVEGQQVASGVAVGSDGKFHGSFQVTQFPGTYHVTASQKAADGSNLQATTGMTVQLNDNRNTPTPGGGGGGNVNPLPTSQPEVSPAGGAGADTSPSPVADASPAPRSTTSTFRPATVAASPFPYLGLAIVLLLVLAAVGLAAYWWWRRREAA